MSCERCRYPADRLILGRCESCAYPNGDGPSGHLPTPRPTNPAAAARADAWAEEDRIARQAREEVAAVTRARTAAEWTPEHIRDVMASARPAEVVR